MVHIGPGQVFIQREPRCPTHGQMHFDMPRDQWICRGFDGEGCGYLVTAEEWHRNGWEHIGWTEGSLVEWF